MSDIDFDELDKAVNSLMQGANRPASQPSDPTANDSGGTQSTDKLSDTQGDVLDMSMVDSIGVSPVQTTEVDVASDSDVEIRPTVRTSATATERSGISVKRRGQFMDVMHPSANMKTPSEAAAESAKPTPSRQGVSLQPTGPVEPGVADTSESKEAESTGGDAVNDMSAVASVESEAAWSSSTGNPEDDSDDSKDASGLVGNSDDEPIDSAAEALAASLIDTGSVSNSPFLPDAKVEKRPLGAADATEELQDTPEVDDTLPSSAELEVGAAGSGQSSEDLPQELEASLVSLEADSTADIATSDNTIGIVPPKIEQDDSQVDEGDGKSASGDLSSAPSTVPPMSPALPSRTPTESVDSGEDEDVHSSIFDTPTQDEQKSQTKHTSSWYTIVIFAGMVMIGILCAVVYYFVTNGV